MPLHQVYPNPGKPCTNADHTPPDKSTLAVGMWVHSCPGCLWVTTLRVEEAKEVPPLDLSHAWRPKRERPSLPSRERDYFDLPSEDRGRLMRAWHEDMDTWWAEGFGWRKIAGYEDGATECCAECLACTGEPEPVRGRDSEDRCAEDGEEVFWVVADV